MMDLILRHATLPDGRTASISASATSKIVAVEPACRQRGAREIEASGLLVSPPFVDAHFHMDATLTLGLPRLNRSGTLLEGIQLWGELKPHLTQEAMVERALAYCDWAVAHGLLAIRSHVDICDPRLLAVDALLEVKKRVKPYLDLQLVAFPQDGYSAQPGAMELLKKRSTAASMWSAASRISNARWPRAPPRCALCAKSPPIAACWSTCIATRPTTRCRAMSRRWRRRRSGWVCRAASPARISPRMHSMDNYYVSKLIPLMAEARAGRHRQSADQHHHPGPPRHLSEAPRHDAGAGTDGGRLHCRLRP